jgi:uncharacterized SAM-binding protein YcdF (DUF218 family)
LAPPFFSSKRFRSETGGVLLWVLLLVVASSIGFVLYALREPLCEAVAEWWVVNEKLEKAQAIVVLGGDDLNGSRVHRAAELYRAGWAPRLILSGGPLRSYFSEVDLMERDALNWGVPKDRLILFRHHATSTLEEARALESVLAQHNFRKVILVTSSFHTRRARRIFLSVYQAQGTQVLVSAAPDVNFDPAHWWQEREARAAFFLELVKSLYTLWELEGPTALPAAQPAPAASK